MNIVLAHLVKMIASSKRKGFNNNYMILPNWYTKQNLLYIPDVDILNYLRIN